MRTFWVPVFGRPAAPAGARFGCALLPGVLLCWGRSTHVVQQQQGVSAGNVSRQARATQPPTFVNTHRTTALDTTAWHLLSWS